MSLRYLPLLAALLACCFVGCNENSESTTSDPASSHDDHDGHDHEHGDHIKPDELGLNVDSLPSSVGPPMPESFGAAVSQVAGLVATVNAGLAKGDVDSVHHELHDLGNAIENAKSLASSSNQPEEVTTAVQNLFDAFTDIDAKLHDEEGKDFAEVKDDIEAAMKTLSATQEN